MIRTKGEAGTGNVVEAVRHARSVNRDIKKLITMDDDELFMFGAFSIRQLPLLAPAATFCCQLPASLLTAAS